MKCKYENECQVSDMDYCDECIVPNVEEDEAAQELEGEGRK